MAFNKTYDEARAYLENWGRILRDVCLIARVSALTEEQTSQVRDFAFAAQFAVLASLVEFGRRFGNARDAHGAFVEKVLAGKKDSEDLVEMDLEEVYGADPGTFCLRSLRSWALKVEGKAEQDKRLMHFCNVVQNCARHTRGAEKRAQTMKRKAQVEKQFRTFSTVVGHTIHSDIYLGCVNSRAEMQKKDLRDDPPPPPPRRYTFGRIVDIFRSMKLTEVNSMQGVGLRGKTVKKSHNKPSADDALHPRARVEFWRRIQEGTTGQNNNEQEVETEAADECSESEPEEEKEFAEKERTIFELSQTDEKSA
ncbi:unnamed protein product [Amoebophrya sp. A25]|nr:unnamed protein product [Amoebophrya sp. A25]|eukprot:GSA25T00019931001.1